MANPQGRVTINGGSVLYLSPPPVNPVEFRNELRVLQSFLIRWNMNAQDTIENPEDEAIDAGKYPTSTQAYPNATRILVTRPFNQPGREASEGEEDYIGVLVATDANWVLKANHNGEQCHEYGANVHIFCRGRNPANGIKSFVIQQGLRRMIEDHGMKQDIANADANLLGVLGQGALA